MTLSKEAEDNKPKKPLNAYFKFRGEKLIEFKDESDRTAKIKAEWEGLDPKVKTEMDDEYKDELEKYKRDIEAWRNKYDVSDAEMKRKSKKKREEVDEEEKKPIKTKGTKESKQAPKEEEKKKEEPKKNKSAEKDKTKGKKEADKKKK